MPSSDYGNAVGGGLKLKGAKDAGVKKKKKDKKDKKPKPTESEAVETPEEASSLQKALAEEERSRDESGVVERSKESETRECGKTEAQKQYEERRRKRVCLPSYAVTFRERIAVKRASAGTNVSTARRPPEARGYQNAQGESRRAQQIPFELVRAP